MISRKIIALWLCLALCLQLASAASFSWQSGKAKKCVKERKCKTKGTTAVCGKLANGRRIGFPNRCYYACVNYNAGEIFSIDHWYNPSDKCYKKWTKKCSKC